MGMGRDAPSAALHHIGIEDTLGALQGLASAFRETLLTECRDTWDEGNLNLIFVHYVMGLVVASSASLNAAEKFELICRITEEELPSEAARLALHTPPPPGRGSLACAIEAAEQAGLYDAKEMTWSKIAP